MVLGAGTTQQVNRARAAAEEDAAGKAAAEAAEAAERLQMEEQLASIALRMQQVHAQLGNSVVPPSAPAPDKEETVCVVCMDAPNQYATVPCNCAFARGVRNQGSGAGCPCAVRPSSTRRGCTGRGRVA